MSLLSFSSPSLIELRMLNLTSLCSFVRPLRSSNCSASLAGGSNRLVLCLHILMASQPIFMMRSIRSPEDAAAALQLSRASRDILAAEHDLIEAKLQESKKATAMLSKLKEQSLHDLAEAEKDIGRVRAFIRGSRIRSTDTLPLHISTAQKAPPSSPSLVPSA